MWQQVEETEAMSMHDEELIGMIFHVWSWSVTSSYTFALGSWQREGTWRIYKKIISGTSARAIT